MAYIKINQDVFNISDRIKEIDSDYFIVYNTKLKKYEVHNSSQNMNSYCLTCPYNSLDKRLLDYTQKTRIVNFDKIIKEIDENNLKIEKEVEDERVDRSKIMLNEIYKYANVGSKEFDAKNAYKNKWI